MKRDSKGVKHAANIRLHAYNLTLLNEYLRIILLSSSSPCSFHWTCPVSTTLQNLLHGQGCKRVRV